MTGQYFLKDKKADLFSVAAPENGDMSPRTFTKISTLWAYASQLSEDLVLRSKAYGSSETKMFVFNYNSEIKTGGMIRYRGKWYTISRVDTTADYTTDMFVYAFDSDEASAPTSADIVKE